MIDLLFKIAFCSGLVPALVKLIEKHNARNFQKHSCEEFICDMNKKSCNHGELDEMEGKEDSSPKESDSSGN